MHERAIQISACTLSLVAHGMLLVGISDITLVPDGSPMPSVHVVIQQSSNPSGATLPAASTPTNPPAPEARVVPAPAASASPDPAAAAKAMPASLTAVRVDQADLPAQPGPETIAASPAAPEPIEAPVAPRPSAEPETAAPVPPPTRITRQAADERQGPTSPSQLANNSRANSRRGISPARDRDHYLAEVLAHIEANKYYPRAARRLRLEGEIQVAFLLRDDGRIENVELGQGPALLRTAARRALERAAPLPQPPVAILSPFPCVTSCDTG